MPAAGGIAISARNGDGLEELKQALLDNLAEMGYGNQDLLISQARHKGLLEQAAQALERVRQHLEAGYSGDLLALDLRRKWTLILAVKRLSSARFFQFF